MGFDDRQMDSLTDIGDCRVVFATEEDLKKKVSEYEEETWTVPNIW